MKLTRAGFLKSLLGISVAGPAIAKELAAPKIIPAGSPIMIGLGMGDLKINAFPVPYAGLSKMVIEAFKSQTYIKDRLDTQDSPFGKEF